jgi:Sugar (and other) transporter
MLPEILPLSVRGTAMGVAICLHWFANFLVSQTFPVLLDKFGPGPVFLGYAVMGAIAFVFVKTLVTETKGRSLEEIEADLQKATGIAGRTREEQRQPAMSR